MNHSLKLCGSLLLISMFASPTVNAANTKATTASSYSTQTGVVKEPTIFAQVTNARGRRVCRQFKRQYGYFPTKCQTYFKREIETRPLGPHSF